MIKSQGFHFFLIIVQLIFLIHCAGENATGPVGTSGMVVSVDEYATQAGIDILKKGGNAVDAAVAVGFALAVTFPAAGNIGGGGFLVCRLPADGEVVALDFREKAPGRASADMYLDENGAYIEERSLVGHLAVGVPGTVKGFELAVQKYGRLSWAELIAPAIKLAEEGFSLSAGRADSFNGLAKRFKNGSSEFLRIFSKTDGSKFSAGDRFYQPELARSLRLILKQGAEAFYTGEIADLIVKDMEKNNGLITHADLEQYRAFVRQPVTGTYRGHQIYSMPPPSSGGTILIEMLNILEGYDLGALDRFAPETIHLITEVMKFAYYDRARYLGDPDFADIPSERLLSKDYAATIRAQIDPMRAVPSRELGAEILTLEEAPETTHYSVIDKDGMAVAVTYTLNGGYGAAVVAEGTGILLNNEMADFNMKPGYTGEKGLIGTRPNLIAPYKRMLSSMTPTLVVKDGRIFMITGSPGGRTIINTVLNVLLNVIDFKMDIHAAVAAARMDHEWMPDTIRLEKDAYTESLAAALEAMGHVVKKGWRQGDAHSILIDAQGRYLGAADPRSRGSAIGY